ncbi:MAG TPA: PaaI family thioesterase, partial [Reyranella sp.]|nr:PaaI family thioesterase [Reyranella sp.]
MDRLQLLNDHQLPFAKVLGLKFVAASETGVKAEMVVTPELCTRPDILHGGAVMAFADTLGAAATVLNLPEGKGT